MLTISTGAGTSEGKVVVKGLRLEIDKMWESLCAQVEPTNLYIVEVCRSESLA